MHLVLEDVHDLGSIIIVISEHLVIDDLLHIRQHSTYTIFGSQSRELIVAIGRR